jgi:hypothetical protein
VVRPISRRFPAEDSWTLLREPAKTEVWTGADCVSIAGWQLCDKPANDFWHDAKILATV